MEQANQHLGTERIGTLIFQYAVPCIISLLVGALYNIVDQVLIANASYLGSYGNAANTVVFPLTVVALAIAVMIGDGCCAFVSISLGKGENDPAKRSVGNAVVMSVGSSLVLTAIYLLFRANIIAMFGGTVNEETYHYSQEYFFYHVGAAVLYVRSVHESCDSSRRKSEICDAVHLGRCCGQSRPRPHFYLWLPVGHDGRCGCHGDWPDDHCGAGGLVPAAYEKHQAIAAGFSDGSERLRQNPVFGEKPPGQFHNFISGCCAVGSAPALGA